MFEIIQIAKPPGQPPIRLENPPGKEFILSGLINCGPVLNRNGNPATESWQLITMDSNYESLGKRLTLKLKVKTKSVLPLKFEGVSEIKTFRCRIESKALMPMEENVNGLKSSEALPPVL